jgi:hypothetical protein
MIKPVIFFASEKAFQAAEARLSTHDAKQAYGDKASNECCSYG